MTMFAKVRLLPPLPIRNTSAYRSSTLPPSAELLLPNRNLKDRTSCIKTMREPKEPAEFFFRTQNIVYPKASLARQLQMMGINPASVTNASMRTGLAITAPISGTISNIRAQIGSYVDVSAPVAEIIDNTSLHLDLQVFEKTCQECVLVRLYTSNLLIILKQNMMLRYTALDLPLRTKAKQLRYTVL